VYFEDDGQHLQPVWTVSEYNQREWRQVQLTLQAAVDRIRFEAVAGIESSSTSVSYIAIDDIEITNTSCTEQGKTINKLVI
jgi:hypothetical protein